MTILALCYMHVYRLRLPTNHRLQLHHLCRPLPVYGTKCLNPENNSMGQCLHRRNFVVFCQVSNAQFHRFPIGQISMGFKVSIYTTGISSKSFPWPVHSIQETSPNFLWRSTRVDNITDNVDITQSQAANHHRLLSNVTLGLIKWELQPPWMQEVNSLCTDS